MARQKAPTRYRVVYGETMPAWEQEFPTLREAKTFAKEHEGFGDIVFSITKIIPGDETETVRGFLTKSATGA